MVQRLGPVATGPHRLVLDPPTEPRTGAQCWPDLRLDGQHGCGRHMLRHSEGSFVANRRRSHRSKDFWALVRQASRAHITRSHRRWLQDSRTSTYCGTTTAMRVARCSPVYCSTLPSQFSGIESVFGDLATLPRSRKTSSRVGIGITAGAPFLGCVSCGASLPFVLGISPTVDREPLHLLR